MAKGKKVYKAGETIVKNGTTYMVGQDGQLHALRKTQSRPKADWQEIDSVTVPYENGEYVVRLSENKNAVNGSVKVVSIAKWITDEDGNSKIKNKSGKPIPKQSFGMLAEGDTLKQIANAILKLAKQ